jgi:Kef-type K+ transport system membrane component KefB
MRRAVILVLLLFGMQLVLPLGVRPEDAPSLLTFGFLILAAYTVGEIAVAVRLPKLVGYLVAGVIFGPDVLGVVTEAAVRELAPVSQLAIALIAFLAGAELRLDEVRRRGPTILKMLSAEMGLTFAAVFALVFALGEIIPFLRDTGTPERVAFSMLFAALAVVHSPAVTIAILSETKANGPVARTALGIVLVSDVVVVVLFSGTLALARALAPTPGAEAGMSAGAVAWEILGALLVGALVGVAVALYLRFVRRELLMFGIVVTFFGAELARLAHVETLLTLLTAGFVMENATKTGGEALRHALERSAAPVFVVFFALAGAAMRLDQVAAFWPLVAPIVLVRGATMWGGTVLGARWAGAGPAERKYVWTGLVAQAGVAIGLAAVVAAAYPVRGIALQTFFLAVMAVNQTIGPIVFRQALSRSGELRGETDLSEVTDAPHPPEARPVPTGS